MNINRLAAIDIGSNSVKLLISDAINSNNKIALRTASFTRVPLGLGEDTFSMEYVSEELIFNAKIGLNRVTVIMPAIKTYLHLMKILKAEEIEIPVIGLADGMIRNLYSEKISNIQF